MSKISDNIENAKARAKDSIDQARTLANEKSAAAREKAGDVLQAGKDSAEKGYEATKELASKAAQKSEETTQKMPLSVIAGGVALGALIGSLLPRSKAETKYFGKTGKQISDMAKNAAESAKEAGMTQLDNLGVNKEEATEQLKDLANKAEDAVRKASDAAIDAVKGKKD